MPAKKPTLYYGALLRAIVYYPASSVDPESFSLNLINSFVKSRLPKVAYYEGATIDEIIQQVKKMGWRVKGKDVLDYAFPPRNALEYLMMKEILRAREFSEDDIKQVFTLE